MGCAAVLIVLLPLVLSIILTIRLMDVSKAYGELSAKVEVLSGRLEAAAGENGSSGDISIISEDRDTGVASSGAKDTGESESDMAYESASDGKKRVYITFDDGPSVYTGQILDTLKKYNTKATFFVCGTGDEDEDLRGYYKRIVDEGHVIGMHSYSHVYSDLYYSAESFEYDLDKIRNLIYNETGIATSIYRFPGGSSNTVSAHEMSTYIPILYAGGIEYYDWNVYPGDASGGNRSASEIVSNTLKGVDKVENAIIVLHDTASKKSTVEALPEILEGLRERDCEILPFDENTPVIHQFEMPNEEQD